MRRRRAAAAGVLAACAAPARAASGEYNWTCAAIGSVGPDELERPGTGVGCNTCQDCCHDYITDFDNCQQCVAQKCDAKWVCGENGNVVAESVCGGTGVCADCCEGDIIVTADACERCVNRKCNCSESGSAYCNSPTAKAQGTESKWNCSQVKEECNTCDTCCVGYLGSQQRCDMCVADACRFKCSSNVSNTAPDACAACKEGYIKDGEDCDQCVKQNCYGVATPLVSNLLWQCTATQPLCNACHDCCFDYIGDYRGNFDGDYTGDGNCTMCVEQKCIAKDKLVCEGGDYDTSECTVCPACCKTYIKEAGEAACYDCVRANCWNSKNLQLSDDPGGFYSTIQKNGRQTQPQLTPAEKNPKWNCGEIASSCNTCYDCCTLPGGTNIWDTDEKCSTCVQSFCHGDSGHSSSAGFNCTASGEEASSVCDECRADYIIGESSCLNCVQSHCEHYALESPAAQQAAPKDDSGDTPSPLVSTPSPPDNAGTRSPLKEGSTYAPTQAPNPKDSPTQAPSEKVKASAPEEKNFPVAAVVVPIVLVALAAAVFILNKKMKLFSRHRGAGPRRKQQMDQLEELQMKDQGRESPYQKVGLQHAN